MAPSPSRIPRVSVGLPVYNGERFLADSLESILAQTFEDFEIIISDNASTDRTEDICRSFSACDSRIRYYRSPENRGLAWNYRRVFELATAEYFKWAAGDDVCAPEYLARCVEVLDSEPTVVLVYPRTRFIDEGGRPLPTVDPGWDLRSAEPHERLRYVLYSRHWVNVIFGLVRAAALAQTRLVASYPGGDYRLLGELALLGKFLEIPDYLFSRRLHPGASSHRRGDLQWGMRFYTGRTSRLSLPTWNRTFDHFRTIARSRVALSHKLSLIGSLLRSTWWQRRYLETELRVVCQWYLTRLLSRT